MSGRRDVIVVGGGFAGVGCARRLARDPDVRVTLIDRNNYHQFQPLVYQVATCQLVPNDIAYSLRRLFRQHPNVDVKLAEVVAVDTAEHTVIAADGHAWTGDALVLRRRIGAELLPDAGRRGPQLSALLARPRRASAIADPRFVRRRRPRPRPDEPRSAQLRRRRRGADRRGGGRRARRDDQRDHERRISRPRCHRGAGPHRRRRRRSAPRVLRDSSRLRRHVLERNGVHLHMGVAVREVAPDHVKLADVRRSPRTASSGAVA